MIEAVSRLIVRDTAYRIDSPTSHFVVGGSDLCLLPPAADYCERRRAAPDAVLSIDSRLWLLSLNMAATPDLFFDDAQGFSARSPVLGLEEADGGAGAATTEGVEP